jgi:hypothetical protein
MSTMHGHTNTKNVYTFYVITVAICSRTFAQKMNASVTMRQAGESKKMAEARLPFEERKTITILIQFFFLKMCIHFLAPSVCVCS